MPRLQNHEPMFHGTHRGWTPMDSMTASEVWESEHDLCRFCLGVFHLDQLEKVPAERNQLGCPECREFIAKGEGE